VEGVAAEAGGPSMTAEGASRISSLQFVLSAGGTDCYKNIINVSIVCPAGKWHQRPVHGIASLPNTFYGEAITDNRARRKWRALSLEGRRGWERIIGCGTEIDTSGHATTRRSQIDCWLRAMLTMANDVASEMNEERMKRFTAAQLSTPGSRCPVSP
jgi:hypothetical protein